MRDYPQFAVRMEPDLHEQVKRLAKRQERSMNSFIVRAVRQAVENTASAPTA